MTFLAGLQLAVKIAPWAACGIAVVLWLLARNKADDATRRAVDAEKTLLTINADNARKNAALQTIADNAERLKNEKTRIAKSDLDGLIAIVSELPDMVRKELPTGDSGAGADSTDTEAVLSGRIVHGQD